MSAVTDSPRICPACHRPFPDNDPRRRYDRPSCRQWVYKVGGLRAAADLKEAFARDWQDGGTKLHPQASEFASECRRDARVLRSYAGDFFEDGPR
jgi:hypothetical protein